MTKGVFLVVFGDPCYMRAAFNLAVSLKYFEPDLKIALLHDNKIFAKDSFDMQFFDDTILMQESDMSSPAKIKTSIYKYLPYDYNLVLDVDALALSSPMALLDRCIDSGKNYFVHVYHSYTSKDPDDMGWLLWAYRSKIWEHFKLKAETILPAPQSSIQFIKKCQESEDLFELINKNINNPIPLHELRYQWGGNQPDELYLAGSLAQLGLNPHIGNDGLFFANKNDLVRSLTQITRDHCILSIFGGKNFTKPAYREWYDRLIITYTRKFGFNRCFKFGEVVSNKHADSKNPLLISTFNQNQKKSHTIVQSSQFPDFYPITSTKLIDSGLLIQNYESPTRRPIIVQSWLNPSAIEFKGKRILVYRMESKPWCVTTKLGICLLDDNDQPIKESNVLLDLHSDLKTYAKGFHVEDPRFFVFNDELYLSYCDGYQMAQAKINIDTLQAEESFYLRKPVHDRTEKNWTFFEHENKIMSVYQVHPHTIFEMNGADYKNAYQTEYNINWKWGILRGGTSPIKINEDQYLSFFHSSIDTRDRQRQYYMGAYIFSTKAPFEPLFISKEPLISGNRININIPRMNNRIYVVFPGGVIPYDEGYKVYYGYNDHQCRIFNVTNEMLKDNLVEIVYQNKLVEA